MDDFKKDADSINTKTIAPSLGDARALRMRLSRGSRNAENALVSPPLGKGDSGDDGAPSTKKAHLVALLVCDVGATVEQMIEITGWLPHTVRAALTGLRKEG